MSTEKYHSLLKELSSKTTAYLNLAPENKQRIITDLLISLEGMLNRMANPQNRPAENTFQEDLQCLLHLAERLQTKKLLAAVQQIKETMKQNEEQKILAVKNLLQQVQESLTFIALEKQTR